MNVGIEMTSYVREGMVLFCSAHIPITPSSLLFRTKGNCAMLTTAHHKSHQRMVMVVGRVWTAAVALGVVRGIS